MYRQVRLYPLGNVKSDAKYANCVSAYMVLADAANAHDDVVECKFSMRLRHPTADGRHYGWHSGSHTFTADQDSYGFHALPWADQVDTYIDAHGQATLEVRIDSVVSRKCHTHTLRIPLRQWREEKRGRVKSEEFKLDGETW